MSVLGGVLGLLVLVGTVFLSYLEVVYRLVVPVARKSVAGRRVLITGAGHGLGRLMALDFAREKAVLVLWDINQTNNEKTAKEVRELSAEAFTYTVDCTSSESVQEAAQRVFEEVGDVYMLINNAGVLVGEDILTLSDRNITQTLNINILAHFWTIRSFLPAMLERNEGHIVSIASMAGKQGTHRLTDYSASKFAAVGLREALADEITKVFRKPGVLTTVVCPMFIDTGMIHSVDSRLGEDTMMKAEVAVDQIMDGILRNQTEILIPSASCKVSMLLKALLPSRGFQAFIRANKVNVPSQAQKNK